MPLSASSMINQGRGPRAAGGGLDRLPDELRQARWLLKERDEFLAKDQREADDILDAARARAERMVQRTEVVQAAEHARPADRRGGRRRGRAACATRPRTTATRGSPASRSCSSARSRRSPPGARSCTSSRCRRRRRRALLGAGGDADAERRRRRSSTRTTSDRARPSGVDRCIVVGVAELLRRTRQPPARSQRRGAARRARGRRLGRVPEGAPTSTSTSSSRRCTTALDRHRHRPGPVAGSAGAAWAGRGRARADGARGVRARTPPRARPIRSTATDRPRAAGRATRCSLELPLAPLCDADCAGPVPRVRGQPQRRRLRPSSAPGDPRWAALERHSFDEPDG